MKNRLPLTLLVLLWAALPVQATQPLSTSALPVLGNVFSGAAGVLLMLFFLVMIVAWVAGMWIVFQRAGESGVAAIIPIYNIIVLCRITGNPEWWVLLCFIPFGSLFVLSICYIGLATQNGKSVGFGIGMALLPFVFVP